MSAMSRLGILSLCLRGESLSELQSLLLMDEGTVLVGSQEGRLLLVDLATQQVTTSMTTEAGVCLLKPSEELVCCGEVTGRVELLDPRSLESVVALDTHPAGLSDMDVVGPYLVTCGITEQ